MIFLSTQMVRFTAHRFPIFAFIFLSCTPAAIAAAGNGKRMAYTEDVSFPSCEFIAVFPTKTRRTLTNDGALATEMVISVQPENDAVFRAECQPLSDRTLMLRGLRDLLQRYIAVLGLRGSEVSIRNGKLGVVGTFSGLKTDQMHTFRFHGQYTVGRHSAMYQMVVEPADSFPSEKSRFFLDSVTKR